MIGSSGDYCTSWWKTATGTFYEWLRIFLFVAIVSCSYPLYWSYKTNSSPDDFFVLAKSKLPRVYLFLSPIVANVQYTMRYQHFILVANFNKRITVSVTDFRWYFNQCNWHKCNKTYQGRYLRYCEINCLLIRLGNNLKWGH